MQIPSDEYNPYYKPYIEKVRLQGSIWQTLKAQGETIYAFYKGIPVEKHDFAYKEGKWTVKEVLLHITDTERIFAYRALRIARKDKTPLPGFDQDVFVAQSNATSRPITSILEEYKAVRTATVTMFESFSDEVLKRKGCASESEVSVRALGFMIVGHEKHHQQIIKERYL